MLLAGGRMFRGWRQVSGSPLAAIPLSVHPRRGFGPGQGPRGQGGFTKLRALVPGTAGAILSRQCPFLCLASVPPSKMSQGHLSPRVKSDVSPPKGCSGLPPAPVDGGGVRPALRR